MNIQSTVKVINPLREGISRSTGNPWKAMDIIIEWPDGEHYQLQSVTLYGEDARQFANSGIRVGDVIEGDLQLTTENFNGRVYNRAILRRVTKIIN